MLTLVGVFAFLTGLAQKGRIEELQNPSCGDRQLCKTAAVSWIEFEQRLWGECKMHLSKRFQSVRLATRVNREKPWHMCGIWTDVKALPTNINDLQDLRQKFLECFQKTNIHYKLSPATFTKLFFPCRLKNTFAQPWN